jgi:DNA-binding PadR family transcriptional regulator
MLALGDKILDNLNEGHMKKYFLDRDFRNRTVLKIISENKFYPLLSSEKVNRLINELWVGSKTYQCDGRLA